MRGGVTDAGRTTDQTVKIELLSRWKLEAEFRNIKFRLNVKHGYTRVAILDRWKLMTDNFCEWPVRRDLVKINWLKHKDSSSTFKVELFSCTILSPLKESLQVTLILNYIRHQSVWQLHYMTITLHDMAWKLMRDHSCERAKTMLSYNWQSQRKPGQFESHTFLAWTTSSVWGRSFAWLTH